MCTVGDIILVYNPIREQKPIGIHSFVVLDDCKGTIKGLEFDFIGLLMSSMDTDKKRKKLMKFDGNFPITPDEQNIMNGGNGKQACIKSEQFYFFNKNSVKFKVIGKLDAEVFNLLIEFIEELNKNGITFQQILDNLKIKTTNIK